MKNEPINPYRGLLIPDEVLLNDEFTYGEKFVLGLIFNLDRPPRHCYASNKYLAQKLNISMRSLENILARLYKKGWVKMKGQGIDRVLIYTPPYEQ